MNSFQRPVLVLFAALLSACAAALLLVEQEPPKPGSCFGGGNKWCIQNNVTACSGGGIPQSCQEIPGTGLCKMCKLIVSSYSICKFIDNPNYDCTETISPTSPWCGRIYQESVVNGQCPNNCDFNTQMFCGRQIPVVTGQTCPP